MTSLDQFYNSLAQLVIGAALVAMGCAMLVWGHTGADVTSGASVVIGIGAGMMPGPGQKMIAGIGAAAAAPVAVAPVLSDADVAAPATVDPTAPAVPGQA